MKRTLFLSLLSVLTGMVCAQSPANDYEEWTDTKPHDGVEVWNRVPGAPRRSWASTDCR